MKNSQYGPKPGFRGKYEQGIECTVVGRNRYPDLESLGVKCLRGDIADKRFVIENFTGFDAVFHVAALAGIWGSWRQYYRINVLGTQNIIDGCQANSIPALIYTSTPSVVFAGGDIAGGSESLPYPDRFLCGYAKSKAMAERLVLSVNQNILRTCAIRPHLIWGPEDPHLIPRLLERGRNKLLKIVGDGSNVVDITYIDNVADAHVLAARSLCSDCVACGKAYFIGQERPVKIWSWINDLFQRANIPEVTEKVSFPIAYAAGAVLEAAHKLASPKKEPRMTRFLAQQLARSHHFSHERARRDLNYHPRISIEEGMEKLIHWLNNR